MKELTSEQYEQLPEFVREDYVLDGESYKHAGVMKMKGTLNDLNSKLETQKNEYGQLNTQLSEFQQSKAAEIEQARADALAQAVTKGDKDDIEAIYEQKMADLKERTAKEVRSEVENEFRLKGVQAQADLELTELVAGLKPKDDFSARLIKDHLKGRQEVQDGKIIYFNEDGGASTLDKAGLLAELRESPMFKPLSSYVPTVNGGGKMQGSNGGGAPESKIKNVNSNGEKHTNVNDYIADNLKIN